MQAVTSAVQRAGVNRSFTGMGSRSSSTPKLPMSRTASGSILDNRQEQDAGDVLHAAASGPCAAHVSSLADKAFSVTLAQHHPKLHMMRQPCMHCLLPPSLNSSSLKEDPRMHGRSYAHVKSQGGGHQLCYGLGPWPVGAIASWWPVVQAPKRHRD